MRSISGPRAARAALGALAAFAVAAGIGYAAIPDTATGVYHACMRNNVGTVRIIDPATSTCNASSETAISFNREGPAGPPGPAGPAGADGTNGTNGANGVDGTDGQDGQDGQDGVSPTVTLLGPGNPYCNSGGWLLQDATGVPKPICHGDRGAPGATGATGPAGPGFGGTYTSPNGQYSLSVTDAGVVISSPDSTIRIVDNAIRIETMAGDLIDLRGSANVRVEGGANVDVRAGSSLDVRAGGAGSFFTGGALGIRGSSVSLNAGTCQPAARMGDPVGGSAGGGSFGGAILAGSATVCIG